MKNYAKRAKNKRAITLAKLVQSIIRYILIIIAIIIIINIFGFDITAVLAGAGIAGLIIGLGAQSLISDFLAGLGIAFENYYEIDDVVEIMGFKGTVIEMGLRSTKIMNWKGEVKIIANGEIKELINYSRTYSIAVVKIVLSYDENIDKVITLLEEKLPTMNESFPQIIEGPNVIGVSDLKDKGIEIQINAKTKAETHYAVERALRKRIVQILHENNIKIPYPQIVLQEVDRHADSK
jgi:small conductance mechanosensitive channel